MTWSLLSGKLLHLVLKTSGSRALLTCGHKNRVKPIKKSKMVRRKSIGRKFTPVKNKNDKFEALTEKSKRKVIKRSSHILQEIKTLQKTTGLIIPKAPFARLVKEILVDLFPRHDTFRMQLPALEALQEAAEMYIVQFFEDAVLLCLHDRRVTLMQRDMILLRRLRGRNDIINR